MSYGKTKIRTLIENIQKGNYVIPEFQRNFDWQPSMVNDLFVSIFNDIYSGTLLFWKLPDNYKSQASWASLWGASLSETPEEAILDGQQRLSSIYYALCNPKKVFPNKKSFYYFYLNLDEFLFGDEDKSVGYRHYSRYRDFDSFKNDKELLEKGYFPLCLLSDTKYIDSNEYQDWITNYYNSKIEEMKKHELTLLNVSKKIEKCLSYTFTTETLVNDDPSEICTIFARINSKGMKLDIFDLMNAFLYPKNIRLKNEWDEIENDKLKEFDDQVKVYLLKLMSLFKQRYCSSKYLYYLIPGSEIKDRHGNKTKLIENTDIFMKLWNNAVFYAEKARQKIMNSGTNDFGAIKPKFVPNTTILPVLGALILHYETFLKKTISEDVFWCKIKKWYWSAVFSGDYSGSSDSVMAEDYKAVLKWLDCETEIPERVKKVNSIFIDNSLDLFNVKNTNSSQYCAILNILAIKTAKDFYSGRILGNFSLDEINDHHIFPVKSRLTMKEIWIESILNKTLIHVDTNKKIRETKPSQYYLEILKYNQQDKKTLEKIMNTHLISYKALYCLQNDDFEGFLRERNITIKNEIKNLLGLSLPKSDSTIILPDEPYDNEIKYVSYFENSIDFIYLIDSYFNSNTLRLISKGIKNNKNSLKQIKILTSEKAIDDNIKKELKRYSKQMENKNIKMEVKIMNNKIRIHDRYLITKDKSYNFISADIASRGQISHIKEVPNMEEIFNDRWNNSEDIK